LGKGGIVLLTVARIGRAHGLRGEVTLEVRTDHPESRFAVGNVFVTDPAGVGPLTVAISRHQGGRWFAAFAEASDRTAAEALKGTLLMADADVSAEEDAWYVHELIGLLAERSTGERIGEVVDVDHPPAQDLLVIQEPNGHRASVPMVSAFVKEVDIAHQRIVVDPPFGLLSGEDVRDAD
jgi:16S rRNA processing protein RimM